MPIDLEGLERLLERLALVSVQVPYRYSYHIEMSRDDYSTYCLLADRLPALIEEMRELRASNIRLLQALRLLTPADGWAGYEDAEGREIGTLVQAAIDGTDEDEELRELRADKERLDTMELDSVKNLGWLHHSWVYYSTTGHLEKVCVPPGTKWNGSAGDVTHTTIRAAIDAARKEQAC